MTFSTKVGFQLSGAALIVTTCGNDPKAANEANFEAALNAHYAQMKQCIRVGSAPNADGIIQEFKTDGRVRDKQLSFLMALWTWAFWTRSAIKRIRKTLAGKSQVKPIGLASSFQRKERPSYVPPHWKQELLIQERVSSVTGRLKLLR